MKTTRTRYLAAACAFIMGMTALVAQDADTTKPAVATNTAPAGQAEATNPPTAIAKDATSDSANGKDENPTPVVVVGHDTVLRAGDTADAVVVVFGSAVIHGKVRNAVVAICGDVDVEGGEVGDAVVAVMGDVKAGPGAKIHGETVAVGGALDIDDAATVEGQKVALPGLRLVGLRKWFMQCVLKMRPLAPQVGWVWGVAGVFFLLYLFIAVVFPRPVEACLEELHRRPATTFLVGLLLKLLLPLIFLILAVTVVGAFVIPFVWVALLLGVFVGKVAIFEWLGTKIGGPLGLSERQKPVLAFVLGAIVVTLLYTVWVVGFLTFLVLSVWGLGIAATAAFGGFRREMPEKPSAPLPGASSPVPASATMAVPLTASMMATAPEPGTQPQAAPPPQAASAAMPPLMTSAVVPDVLAFPKAGFWERMAAAFLDIVLVGIVGAMIRAEPPWIFLVALAYFTGLWAWKGTTVGGVVLGLRVVRHGGQALTFPVALVRALAGGFSVVVLFLGFLWIAWDSDKQGWHDKIAGTVVLRMPKGTPLVVF